MSGVRRFASEMDDLSLEIAVISVIAAVSAVKVAREAREKSKRWKNRRWWTRPWIERRNEGGKEIHSMLCNELRVEDPDSYRHFLRMNEDAFKKLLSMLEPSISKKNTNMRESISAERRLVLTLRFLATGENYRSLMFAFRISTSTIAKIIPEVCRAIYHCLKENYFKVPSTSEEWEKIALGFQELSNFPNCLGALDGKHVEFRPPRNTGSFYYNYKGGNSIVLLALVDAHYRFLFVDIGCNGRVSDGGVFRQSVLSQAMAENYFHFPQDSCLPGTDKSVPYVSVADDAFPLKNNLMKPFKSREITINEKVFNYRLSRARRTVENAFGILCNRFRILLKKIEPPVHKVEVINLAACSLYNYLIEECSNIYFVNSDNSADTQDCILRRIPRNVGNRPTNESQEIREEFKEYFNTCGSVLWQWDAIKNFNF